ncbi:MAG TPA: type II toxin-antitoxin system MqsA family antitoxin [Xanthobacteraceae bacterium]|nr:type II toxin-antitoxin system MqsA family antitoxin [Xanthobacteraceae bacterium]
MQSGVRAQSIRIGKMGNQSPVGYVSKKQTMTRRCPACSGVMRRGVMNETVTFQGHSLTYEQPGWHCEVCDEGVLEGEDNAFHDAALHEVMARAKGSPISPLTIRAAREAVGLSQREAGRVFGGGPTAFYKYETAKAVPSDGMANLLHLALERPDLFRKSPRGTTPTPSVSDITLIRRASLNDTLGNIIRRVYPEGPGKENLS